MVVYYICVHSSALCSSEFSFVVWDCVSKASVISTDLLSSAIKKDNLYLVISKIQAYNAELASRFPNLVGRVSMARRQCHCGSTSGLCVTQCCKEPPGI